MTHSELDTITALRRQVARLTTERDQLAALLRDARTKLWEHHEAGYRLEWGEPCLVCSNGGDYAGGIFERIDAALAALEPGAGGRREREVSLSNRIPLTVEQALARMPDGDRVHTVRQSGLVLLGASWDRDDLIAHLRQFGVEVAGDNAIERGHGLVCVDDSGPLFIRTRDLP